MNDFAATRMTADVDVWRARLSGVRLSAGELLPLLTQPERTRAGSYRLDSDRTRFVAVRGLLRTLLGGYVARPPASVPLTVRLNGKPETNGIYFNVAHPQGVRTADGSRMSVCCPVAMTVCCICRTA